MNNQIKCSRCSPLGNTHAVACDSLSQNCQWRSPVRQTKLTKVHFKTRELFLASVAACNKTLALPQTS